MAVISPPEERPVVTRSEAKTAGAKRYFTGKPCPAGHVAERQVSAGDCVICLAARSVAKRAAISLVAGPGATRYFTGKPCKRGHIAERSVSSGHCVICDTAKSAARRAANPVKMQEKMASYYAAHSQKIRARSAAWAATNPDRVRATMAAHHALHPGKRKAQHAIRRARERQATGNYTANDIKALFTLQRGKCAHPWCTQSLAARYHADHIIPLARGGSNDKRNMQLLCEPCNRKKWAHHPIDLAQRHGLLL